MPAIGYVTKLPTGGYKGQIKTLSIRADIDIIPNTAKGNDMQPDFRVMTATVLSSATGGPPMEMAR